MGMIKIDGKEISMIEFIEKKIRKVIRVCSANGSSIEGIVRENGFFYDEEDFQISLVREFEKYYPKMKVFYENPSQKNKRERIDIVLKLKKNEEYQNEEDQIEEYQIELKYSYQYDQYDSGTKLEVIIADSLGEDIKKCFEESNMEAGYCVVLANKNNKENIKELLEKCQKQVAFSLDKGTLSGTLKYKDKENVGQITIINPCLIRYAEIENYQYLIIEISKDNFRDDK